MKPSVKDKQPLLAHKEIIRIGLVGVRRNLAVLHLKCTEDVFRFWLVTLGPCASVRHHQRATADFKSLIHQAWGTRAVLGYYSV